MKNKNLKALSSIEIILSLSMFFVLVLGLSSAIFYGLNVKKEVGEETKATFILDEGIEALYNIKDSDFTSLIEGNWGLIQSSGQWALSPNSDQTDGYVRQIAITNIDENDKEAVVSVNWISGSGRVRSISTSIRLTNWERMIFTDNSADWSNPIYAGSYDLPNTNGGFRVKLGSDKAYMLFRRPNLKDFQIFDLSNLPTLTPLGGLTIDGLTALYDMFIDGNYVYLTGKAFDKEVLIIDVSDPNGPLMISSLDLPGSSDSTGVYKSGEHLYVTRLNNKNLSELYIVNVADPLNPYLEGELNLSTNNIYDIWVSQDHAYLATSADNGELLIVNISNPMAPTFVSGLDLPTNTNGTRLTYYNGIVYLAQGDNIRLINVNNPQSPILLSTYDAGGDSGDLITAFPEHPYIFLATSNSAMEFQVIDVSDPVSPLIYGFYNTGAGLLGVDYDPLNELIAVVGNDNTEEFVLFSGRSLN